MWYTLTSLSPSSFISRPSTCASSFIIVVVPIPPTEMTTSFGCARTKRRCPDLLVNQSRSLPSSLPSGMSADGAPALLARSEASIARAAAGCLSNARNASSATSLRVARRRRGASAMAGKFLPLDHDDDEKIRSSTRLYV